MRKIIVLCLMMFFVSNFVKSQSLSLEIDCQTPGWLSSKIDYLDQLNVQNLKVTGYLNYTDLSFIGSLFSNSLNGRLDLSEVHIIKGKNNDENELINNAFGLGDNSYKLKRLDLPELLVSIKDYFGNGMLVDTLVIGGSNMPILNNQPLFFYYNHVIVREGVTRLQNYEQWENYKTDYKNYSTYLQTKSFQLPNTIDTIDAGYFADNTMLTQLNIPDSVEFIGNCAFKNTSFVPEILYWPKKMKNFSFSVFYGSYPSIIYLAENVEGVGTVEYISKNYYPLIDGDAIEMHLKSHFMVKAGCVNRINNGTPDYLRNFTVYVPSDLIEVYKADKYWKYAKILPEIEIEQIVFNLPECLYVGDILNSFLVYYPSEATDTKVDWSSDNDTVISKGNNDALQCNHFGKALLTARTSYNRITAEKEINVYEHTTGIELDQKELELNVGESSKINVSVLPVGLSDGRVTWSSSDNEIATVDENGVVLARKGGLCEVICISKDRGYVKSCKIKVTQPVTGVKLDKTEIDASKIGEIINLTATVFPEDATNKEVIWTSSNEDVCIVVSGTVVVVGYGTAIISATTVNGGYTAQCSVMVTDNTDIRKQLIENEIEQFNIYSVSGERRKSFLRGVNVLKFRNGTIKKIVMP